METQTYIVERKRTITESQQHLCDICQEPATSACTDAIETVERWEQSKPRYGCAVHSVTPRVTRLRLDGSEVEYPCQ